MIRKHSKKVLGGVGIDGRLGEDYSRKHAVDPWDSNPKGNYKSPRGAGKYQDDNADFLTNKPPSDPTGGAETKDIFDNVNRNSDIGKPGPIKYGVD
jgi:hypothetical protein